MLPMLIKLLSLLSALVGIIYLNRTLYAVVGFFTTRKFPQARVFHKYAILIAARNEEAVIGNLIESIMQQDYPKDKLDVYVVADNCTDRTAAVASKAGAVCYERFDEAHRTKGYALQFLFDRIRRDVGIDHYEGYFIFDADNLLNPDYVSRMNEAFDAGEKIVTSYRNTKNLGNSWVAASYAIHWLRTIRKEHRARSVFHLAARVQGTGYLFASELVRNGWNFTCLTEDRAFCAEAVANGYKISYQDKAEFFDEQPESLSVALRQRLRWAKGNLIVTAQTGWSLFKHIFVTRSCAKPDPSLPWYKRLVKNLHIRYMSSDMLSVVFPRGLTSLMQQTAVYVLRVIMIFTAGYSFVSLDLFSKTLRFLFSLTGLDPTPNSPVQAFLMLTVLGFFGYVISYFGRVLTAAYVLIVERKRIARLPLGKAILFSLTFPLFDTIGKLAFCIALFKKIDWAPIPHNANIRIQELAQRH